ncbi:hydrolase [Allocoprobacillus halotolerans]|uniref:Hydrolase n=1 Tax=Allocoprobacillus halotolerans TaxID=2944914 RepID=A0ABY5I443_9FIRM|nr:hydrolase [Allocoprobacillus halotolerans]UTY40104.1 hydrolase [Allocoprobacillus halotolerans]
MTNKERFIEIYKSKIHREGSDKLLEFLMSRNSDFFEAPASARFHGSYEGGLLEHSLNVYDCLQDYLLRERVQQTYQLSYSEESIAIVALLHDLCKINCYKKGTRNVKENGQWIQVPTYEYHDTLPYGHGEKSVYMISGYMRLKREEAFAIRYHMGFSGSEDARNVGAAFEMFPLAFALSTADMEATYFIEGKKQNL